MWAVYGLAPRIMVRPPPSIGTIANTEAPLYPGSELEEPEVFGEEEDPVRRAVGVALCGFILLLVAAAFLTVWAGLRPYEIGWILIALGAFVAVVLPIPFALVIGGESAAAAIVAGVALIGAGGWLLYRSGAGWHLVVVGLGLVGAVLGAVGGVLALYLRRRSPDRNG
jgi:hypothetical protein